MLKVAILTESSIWLFQLIREEGMIWEEKKNLLFSPRFPHRYKTRRPPLGTLETNYKMTKWRRTLDLDDLTKKLGIVNSLNLL